MSGAISQRATVQALAIRLRSATSMIAIGATGALWCGLATAFAVVTGPHAAYAQITSISEWTGQTSTDWFTASNWLGGVPTANSLADILTAAPNPTVINSPGATARNVFINNGGDLTVQGGGTLQSFGFALNNTGTGTATATVTGAGSSITDGDLINVGQDGVGTLNVLDGGSATAVNQILVGSRAGGDGAVRVDGAGSLLRSGGFIIVGGDGDGIVEVTGGGQVETQGLFIVGSEATSNGQVVVDGDGSRILAVTNAINVGVAGTGALIVRNGGTLAGTAGFIGVDPGGNGTVTVQGLDPTSGASALWQVGLPSFNISPLVVGGEGQGELNVLSGGIVLVYGGTQIGSEAGGVGTVTIDGVGAGLLSTQTIWVGEEGTGTLNIINGGAVVSGDGDPATDQAALVGAASGAQGTVLVQGAGSEWIAQQQMHVGAGGLGQVTVSNGGSLIAEGFGIGLNGGVGEVIVQTGGTLSANGVGRTVTLTDDVGSEGTLTIGGAVGTAAVAPGDIDADTIAFGDGTATLVFNHTATDLQFDPVLAGRAGTVRVLNGLTELTGDSGNFAGTSFVEGGTMQVTGVLGGDVTVSGGVLRGIGTVTGSVNVGGGIFAPGNSIGTFTIGGDLVLGPSGALEIEIQAPDQSDLINVGGTTTLGGLLIVDGLGLMSAFAETQRYTIIDGAGAIIGAFASVTDTLPDFDVTPQIVDGGDGGQEVVLTLGNGPASDVSDKSIVPNTQQAQVDTGRLFATALEDRNRLGSSAQSVILDDGTMSSYASSVGTPADTVPGFAPPATSRFGVDVALASFVARPVRTAWISGLGGFAGADATAVASGYDVSAYGVATGIDIESTSGTFDWLVGGAVGYTRSDISSDAASADVGTFHIGAYGRIERNAARLSGQLSYGLQDYDMSRLIPVGTSAVTANGNADGHVFAASVTGAYDLAPGLGIDQSNGFSLSPTATLGYVHTHRDGFTETDAGILNQRYNANEFGRGYLRAGVEIGAAVALDGGAIFKPRAGLHWEWGLGEENTIASSTAPAVPGSAFASPGAFESDSGLIVEAGFDFDFNTTVSAQFSYEGTFAANGNAHRMNGGLRLKF